MASSNRDKAREIALLLPGLRLLPRPEGLAEVEEVGESLEDNARLKARAVLEATGSAAIADDTGLEVVALGGAPGVRSARFAGERATYADNVAKLLSCLEGVEDRRACFRTVALAVLADGTELVAEGRVEGTIATEPRGEGGFGYDPVFVPLEGGGLSFAEMPLADKNRISHRGRAFRALAGLIRARTGGGP
ncbi:MAG TPA: RdgB/HAM1 family non-canonical purine NTP pyrophosphatase [Acidimicrobiales bacterium]|nr:RdgB/HAM1 family non-canonical purine NTP pyrophosphatase [Acidimicrobiales bacterium]